MTSSEAPSSQSSQAPHPKYRFLPDMPADIAEDRFGHLVQTEALVDAILASPQPFTLGVFGDWGVGKTTVARDFLRPALVRRIGNKSVCGFVYFDAWKYEGDSLRREFLRVAAHDLSSSKRSLTDLVRDVDVDIAEPVEANLKFSFRRLLLMGGTFGAVLLALYAVDAFTHPSQSDFGGKLVFALVASLATGLASQLGQTVYVPERRVTRRRLDSPEQFQRVFAAIVDAALVEYLVIVVDNLDRCAPARAVGMLATIATFLETSGARRQPVFVIPCDRHAIQAHIATTIGRQDKPEAYLQKLFHAHIDIAPMLDEDVRTYAEQLLEQAGLLEDMDAPSRQLLVDVVRFGFDNNPRAVKQFVNGLVSKLLVLDERVKAGLLPNTFVPKASSS